MAAADLDEQAVDDVMHGLGYRPAGGNNGRQKVWLAADPTRRPVSVTVRYPIDRGALETLLKRRGVIVTGSELDPYL